VTGDVGDPIVKLGASGQFPVENQVGNLEEARLLRMVPSAMGSS
jgi:hypothetical protein